METDRDSKRPPRLLQAEAQMLVFTAAVGLSAVLLIIILQRDIVWPPFVVGYAATLGLAGIGAYVRRAKNAPRIALALVGASIFSGFTAVSAVFIFALFPLPNPLIDPLLLQIDGLFGYHWPALVAWLADYPTIAKGLGHLYHSSLLQMLLTIILLATLSRTEALHRFLLTGIVALILTIAIWWFAPSIGPSAFQAIPEADRLATGLYFRPSYGQYLLMLVKEGPRPISLEGVTGVVAFPSYHMIMTLLVVWSTRNTSFFLPAILVATAMIVATLSHGGHHLIDLFGGLAVFAVSVRVSNHLIRVAGEAQSLSKAC